MIATVSTVAYLGLEARGVEVQCQITPGMPRFVVVGLPDKAVGESRERVRAAIAAIGLSLPPKVITVNLSPADLPKEGSHYDLPIALALLGAMGVIDAETLTGYIVVGELGLDGRVAASPGVLLAAIHAGSVERGLICPAAQGPEAAWAGSVEVLGAPDLLSLLAHFKGQAILSPPVLGAAAFLIAEYLKMSYLDIVRMALIPTCLYYFGLLVMTEIDSRKYGLRAVDPAVDMTMGQLLTRYGFHFTSLISVVVLMVWGFSATYAVFWSILLAILVSYLRSDTALWPGRLFRALADGSLLAATAFTLGAAALGLALGAGLGVLLGLWLGLSRRAAAAAFLSVEVLRPVPSVALIPIAMLVFGFGRSMELSVVAFATLWPVLVMTQAAVRQVEPRLLEVAAALQLGPAARAWKIVLPAVLPRLFVALRLAVAIALVVAVTVEIAANPHGMGYALMSAQQSLEPALMLAWLGWIGLLGFAINAGALRLQRWAARRMGEGSA